MQGGHDPACTQTQTKNKVLPQAVIYLCENLLTVFIYESHNMLHKTALVTFRSECERGALSGYYFVVRKVL